jgi:hypothetical protein
VFCRFKDDLAVWAIKYEINLATQADRGVAASITIPFVLGLGFPFTSPELA